MAAGGPRIGKDGPLSADDTFPHRSRPIADNHTFAREQPMRQIALFVIQLLLLPVISAESTLQAQHSTRPTRVPVTVVLVEKTPHDDAPAVILRRAGMTPQDVVLLRADAADGKQLSSVVLGLISARSVGGDTASASEMLRVRPQPLPPGQVRKELPWAQRVVNDLRRAERRIVPGVGEVQAVEIWLPPQRKRQP